MSTASSPPNASEAQSARLTPDAADRPRPARVIAIANQKGGVGKSTTAVSLGAALADLGHRVLVVDLDPQGNASTGMGIRHEARDVTVYDVVVGDAGLMDAVIPTPVPRLFALPSTIDLAGAEIELVSQFSRETRLKRSLEPVRTGHFDFVFLDCPPSLGLLTINALTAAEELIVPIQCEYYALEGLGQLLRNVSLVQQNINPGLRLTGIVMTMFDPRTKLSEQVVAEVQRFFGELMYDVVIPRTVRLSEAPGFGQPITVYDPRSKGAESYRALAREVALREPPEVPMPSYEDLPAMVMPSRDDRPANGPDESVEAAAEAAEEAEVANVVGGADDAAAVPTVSEIVPEKTASDETAFVDVTEDAAAVEQARVDERAQPVRHAAPRIDDDGSANDHGAPTPPNSSAEESGSPAPPDSSAEESGSPAPRNGSPRAGMGEDIWDQDETEVPDVRVRSVRIETSPGRPPQRRVVVIDDTEPGDAAGGGGPGGAPESGRGTDAATIGSTLRDEDDGAGKRRWRLFRKGGT
jgi:chromosome partitioning protein